MQGTYLHSVIIPLDSFQILMEESKNYHDICDSQFPHIKCFSVSLPYCQFSTFALEGRFTEN